MGRGCSGSRTALNAFWKRKKGNVHSEGNEQVQEQEQVSQPAASKEEKAEISGSPVGPS